MQDNLSSSIVVENEQKGVLRIIFSNLPSNSMPIDLLQELAMTIENLGEDENVQAIILQSGGERTFCSGADFNQLLQIEDEKSGKIFFNGFAKVINACRKSPKIIIGRVQGKSVGGGVGLAAATDYCFATQFASIKLSELNIGIIPAVIEPAVERKIGLSAFSKLTFNPNDFFSAEWAKENGLFMEVFEDIKSMDEAVENLANRLTTYNPEALKELKKILWKNTEHWDELLTERAEISGRLVLSEFTKRTLGEK
ncbi:enoyl-CoA hydratase/isomerase family protein [Arcicella sp. LKC2W]|uniref:enoyl-CoA hydratase/isomerase family protein n=1 Tax=Arcicella sp. LKC2W TaxID=2984198 RepID=UPI002B1EFAC7|nr:enoyl-CoA hydratase/isomerase family protein [Arcicella sp. LKC2W]MEA5461168.1 enoyl-CoA hydratase/isomerase family protein [Arcicella sp. LKC2W]